MTVRDLIDFLSGCGADAMDCDVRVNGDIVSPWDIEIGDDEDEDEE